MILIASISAVSGSATSGRVVISQAHYSVQIGSTVQIKATGSNITWSSSDKDVATVSKTGVVTGKSMGVATITAKSGGSSASCEVSCGFYKGIDVSVWNGDINWSKVKAQGIDFAIIRAGYGWEDYPYQMDKQLVNYVTGCVKNDIPFSLYFYSYAETSSQAVLEAKYLLKIINDYLPSYKDKIALPIAYDLEEDPIFEMPSKTLTDIVISFSTEIQKAGYEAMVYGNTSSFKNMDINKIQSKGIGFWYALWPYSPDFSSPTTVGRSEINANLWQYASDGHVSGVGPEGSDVDMDIMYMLSATTNSVKATTTKVSITAPGEGGVSLGWNAVSGAKYNLYRTELDSEAKIIESKTKRLYSGTKTSYTDKTAEYGKAYYYYTDTYIDGDILDKSYKPTASGKKNGDSVYNIKKNDVNADGTLNLLDAICAQKYSLSILDLNCAQIYAADFDNSGTITLADAIRLQKQNM